MMLAGGSVDRSSGGPVTRSSGEPSILFSAPPSSQPSSKRTSKPSEPVSKPSEPASKRAKKPEVQEFDGSLTNLQKAVHIAFAETIKYPAIQWKLVANNKTLVCAARIPLECLCVAACM